MGTLYEGGDLRTVQSDIGERVIIEGHQLAIGLVPPPPLGEGPSRRNEKPYHRHGWYSCAPLMLHCTRLDVAARQRQLPCDKPAGHKIEER